jgi:hypothetical protein
VDLLNQLVFIARGVSSKSELQNARMPAEWADQRLYGARDSGASATAAACNTHCSAAGYCLKTHCSAAGCREATATLVLLLLLLLLLRSPAAVSSVLVPVTFVKS